MKISIEFQGEDISCLVSEEVVKEKICEDSFVTIYKDKLLPILQFYESGELTNDDMARIFIEIIADRLQKSVPDRSPKSTMATRFMMQSIKNGFDDSDKKRIEFCINQSIRKSKKLPPWITTVTTDNHGNQYYLQDTINTSQNTTNQTQETKNSTPSTQDNKQVLEMDALVKKYYLRFSIELSGIDYPISKIDDVKTKAIYKSMADGINTTDTTEIEFSLDCLNIALRNAVKDYVKEMNRANKEAKYYEQIHNFIDKRKTFLFSEWKEVYAYNKKRENQDNED